MGKCAHPGRELRLAGDWVKAEWVVAKETGPKNQQPTLSSSRHHVLYSADLYLLQQGRKARKKTLLIKQTLSKSSAGELLLNSQAFAKLKAFCLIALLSNP